MLQMYSTDILTLRGVYSIYQVCMESLFNNVEFPKSDI